MHANRILRAKGLDIARRIGTKEKGARAKIVGLDHKEGTDDNPDFWNELGEKPETIKNSSVKSNKTGILIESEEPEFQDKLYTIKKDKSNALSIFELNKVHNPIAGTTVFQQSQLVKSLHESNDYKP